MNEYNDRYLKKIIRVLEKLQLYKTENFSFSLNFLNRDISLNMLYPLMKFYILNLDVVMEGTVSQTLNLSLSFHFIECRK